MSAPSAPRIRLGVDFGTSNTVAVVRWPDGRARPLLFDGSPLLPSAVYAEPSGALIVGRDAVHSARLEPARFDANPKRRVDEGAVLLGDREVPVGELISAVLSRVDEAFRRTVGAVAADTTLTFPAAWGATRRFVLSDAAAAAGLGPVRLVAEPVAAATYFTQVLGRSVPIGSVVVVYDFGAGTFDASVVARTSSGFDVLAVDGRDDLGGLDVDEAVVQLIAKTCTARDPALWQRLMAPSTVEERRARRLLWDDARVAKERLSRHPTADITVALLDAEVHLTREELEELARPVIEQTLRVTQGVIREANLADGRLAGVFLVGGSSRIPLVATLLHRALGEPPVAIEQPEMVVAEGSALTAPSGQVSAAPVSAIPVSGVPVSGAPVSGGSAPTSGAPTSGAPMSVSSVPVSPGQSPMQGLSPMQGIAPAPGLAPVSGAPLTSGGSPASGVPPRSVGRVVVPGAVPPGARPNPGPVPDTRPMPAVAFQPEYAPARVRPAPVASPAPQYTLPPGSSYRAAPARGGGLRRAVLMFLLILLLLAVPVVSGYLAYKITIGEPAWPISISSAGTSPAVVDG